MKNPLNGYTWWHAAKSLGIIGQNNPVAIASLVELINTYQNESPRRLAAESLGKIDKDHPVAFSALVELIRNSGDENTRRQAADSLGAIDKDHPVAFSALVESIGISQDNNNRRQAAYSLEKICQDNPVAIVAVSGLKDCLTSEIYENDFIRYEKRSRSPQHSRPRRRNRYQRDRLSSSVPNYIKQSSPQMQTFPQLATPRNSSD